MGFSKKNKKLNLEGEENVEALRNLVGGLSGESKSDVAKRLDLIYMLASLCKSSTHITSTLTLTIIYRYG
jgi:hypothetical protein